MEIFLNRNYSLLNELEKFLPLELMKKTENLMSSGSQPQKSNPTTLNKKLIDFKPFTFASTLSFLFEKKCFSCG